MDSSVLAFLSGVDNRIFEGVYAPLGDVWDIVVTQSSHHTRLYPRLTDFVIRTPREVTD